MKATAGIFMFCVALAATIVVSGVCVMISTAIMHAHGLPMVPPVGFVDGMWISLALVILGIPAGIMSLHNSSE